MNLETACQTIGVYTDTIPNDETQHQQQLVWVLAICRVFADEIEQDFHQRIRDGRLRLTL